MEKVFNLSNIIVQIMLAGCNGKLENLCFNAWREDIGIRKDDSCQTEPECSTITLQIGISSKALRNLLTNIDLNALGKNLKQKLHRTS